MANTTFSGPVISTNGFIGDSIGTVIQPVAAVTAAGTNLATAAALSNGVNVVGSASGTNGVKLPTAVTGTTITVYNSAATNGLIVYANTSDTINGGASVTMEGSTWLQCIATSDAVWLTTIFTANA